MSTLFLSYSRKDIASMKRVKKILENYEVSVWTDENLTPGTSNWERSIDLALQECKAVIVLLSTDAYASEWVNSEIGKAKAYNRKIYPLLLTGNPEKSVPLSLWNVQRFDLRKNYDDAMTNLVEALISQKIIPDSDALSKRSTAREFPIPKINLTRWILILIVFPLFIIVYGLLDSFTSNANVPLIATNSIQQPQNTNTSPSSQINSTKTQQVLTELFDIPSTLVLTSTQQIQIGEVIVSETDGMDLIYISAGEFIMGSEDVEDDESQIHIVYLDNFWIDKTEVTNAMYNLCVAAGRCTTPFNNSLFNNELYKNHPVVYVSWYDAIDYCSWANRRLPTEAEWEKAARGIDGRIYPWGEGIDEGFANYYENVFDTTSVGSYPRGASPYGVLDMAGNVSEWVSDWYSIEYYSISPLDNPTGPEDGDRRILRGGGLDSSPIRLRSADRLRNDPGNSYFNVGFRCATSSIQ